jgi:hypothetical protein
MKIEKLNIIHLRNDEHFQFHTEFRDLVAKEGPLALKIKPQFDDYLPLYDNVGEALKKYTTIDKARGDIWIGMEKVVGNSQLLAELKVRNNTFEALVKGAMQEARKALDAVYKQICEVINAHILPDGKANYESFVRALNEVIARYNIPHLQTQPATGDTQ